MLKIVGNVDRVIPHQANIRIIEKPAKDLRYPMEKIEVTLDRYGNTSAASVPMALDEAVRSGRVREGDLLMLVAAGAGFCSGAVLVRWEALAGTVCGVKLLQTVQGVA